MTPILYAIPVFLLTILLEAWVARRREAPVYDIADAITSLQLGLFSQVSALFLKLLTLGVYVAIEARWGLFELAADSPWVWLGALLAYDFCYYWQHRLGHEVNLLWAGHVVHHSSEYYNLSTALRQTSTGPLLTWVFYLPLALAGVPPQVFVGVALIDLLYQYWVHTELVGRLGWFDRVFCSPSNHRVHHGQNDYCIDRNYGGILILWDRLFGTFAAERADEPIRFGIRSPLASYDPLWGNLHHYAALWRQTRAAPDLRTAWGIWFGPPGGRGQPLPHFDPDRFTRFAPAASPRRRRYAVISYALALTLAADLLARFEALTSFAATSYALGLAASGIVLAALLHGKPWAPALEAARAAGLAAAFAATPLWFGAAVPPAARFALVTTTLLSLAWLWPPPDPPRN